ncbi:hypothetical protein [Neorhizobium galegae]|uniref:hypothetical protein n=1 Tax=Neorhizobium galegae TaxID=399 RepID=UPI000627ACFD|nr:hypothetical protein [Neorhizobium galegae]
MPDFKTQYAELRGKSIFPARSSIAEFHFRSQIIGLNEIHRGQFEGRSEPAGFANSRFEISTIFHELTHWSDMTGTLWGRRHMDDIHSVLGILDKLRARGSEGEFWKMVYLHDETRRLMYPDYYRVQEGEGKLGAPRENKVDFSAGIEFDSLGRQDHQRPLLFVRFYGSGTLFIRQPMTVGALLETTATWSEIATGFEVAATLMNGADVVEKRLIEKDLEILLSDPDLTIYTAPVRMVAWFAKLDDFIQAYRVAASLAFVCLNLDKADFERLKPPEVMNAWGKWTYAAKQNMDPAFAFACICISAGPWTADSTVESWVGGGLQASNLPADAEIRDKAIAILEGKPKLPDTTWTLPTHYLLSAGLESAKARSATFDPALTISLSIARKLALPPLVDSELEVGRLAFSTFDYEIWNPEQMFDGEWQVDKAVRNMLSACR